MSAKLMNMTMVYDRQTNRVLVLDKRKRYGWEGLTFCGGKVNEGESFYDSAIRELYEESGLMATDLVLVGHVQWIVDGQREVGVLYQTENYTGQVQASEEGDLSWMTLDELEEAEGKSASMAEILRVYRDPQVSEVIFHYVEGSCIRVEFH